MTWELIIGAVIIGWIFVGLLAIACSERIENDGEKCHAAPQPALEEMAKQRRTEELREAYVARRRTKVEREIDHMIWEAQSGYRRRTW